MTECQDPIETAADAILAQVPAGYGMTPNEAREYARAAIEPTLARLKVKVAKTACSPVLDGHVEPYRLGVVAACNLVIEAIDAELAAEVERHDR